MYICYKKTRGYAFCYQIARIEKCVVAFVKIGWRLTLRLPARRISLNYTHTILDFATTSHNVESGAG